MLYDVPSICKLCKGEFTSDDMLIKHFILEHELKRIPNSLGKVLSCPYCKEQFANQHLSKHCHRKHQSEIQRDRSLLIIGTNPATTPRSRRKSTEETSKKIADSTRKDVSVDREQDALRKAESRSKETIEESIDRKDAVKISKFIKKVIENDEDKKLEEQRRDSVRKAKERSQESDDTKAKRIASIGTRSKLKRSQESEEQMKERLKTAAEYVMKHRSKMSEQQKNDILRQRRMQYRGDQSSSNDSQEEPDQPKEVTNKVTKSSSLETLVKNFFKLGQGSMYNQPINAIHSNLQATMRYGGVKWIGFKVLPSFLQIGSYKVDTNEPMHFTKDAIFFRVPMVTYVKNIRTIILLPQDLEDITICIESDPALLFITPDSKTCEILCKDLKMKSDAKKIFLDKNASDHTMKCISIAISNIPETFIDVCYKFYGTIVQEIGLQEAEAQREKCAQTNTQAKFQKGLNKCLSFDKDDSDLGPKVSFQLQLDKPALKIRLGQSSKNIQELQKLSRKCLIDKGIGSIYSKIVIGNFHWDNKTLGKLHYPQHKVFFKNEVIYFNSPCLTDPSTYFTIFILPSEVTKIETYVREKESIGTCWDEDQPRPLDREKIFVFFTLCQNACRRIRQDLNFNAKFLGIHFDSASEENISFTKITMQFEEEFQKSRESPRFILKVLHENYPKVTKISETEVDDKMKNHFYNSNYNALKILQNNNLGPGSIKHTKLQVFCREIFANQFHDEKADSICIGSYVVTTPTKLYLNKETLCFMAPVTDTSTQQYAIFVPYEEMTTVDVYETEVNGRNIAYLFITLMPSACERICEDLNLNFDSKGLYFNSAAKDLTMQRLTIWFKDGRFSSISKHLSFLSILKVTHLDDLNGCKSIHSYAPSLSQNII